MTYPIVGLDRTTFAPWHQNIQARDVTAGTRLARARAKARGINLVVAAVIGPNSSVLPYPAGEPRRPRRRRRPDSQPTRPQRAGSTLTSKGSHGTAYGRAAEVALGREAVMGGAAPGQHRGSRCPLPVRPGASPARHRAGRRRPLDRHGPDPRDRRRGRGQRRLRESAERACPGPAAPGAGDQFALARVARRLCGRGAAVDSGARYDRGAEEAAWSPRSDPSRRWRRPTRAGSSPQSAPAARPRGRRRVPGRPRSPPRWPVAGAVRPPAGSIDLDSL